MFMKHSNSQKHLQSPRKALTTPFYYIAVIVVLTLVFMIILITRKCAQDDWSDVENLKNFIIGKQLWAVFQLGVFFKSLINGN